MDNRRTRRKRVRRFIAYTLVILTAVICAAVAWGVYQFQHDPAYWTANENFLKDNPSQQIDALAMEAERIIINALSTFETDANGKAIEASKEKPIQRTINLSTDQINAWLDRRMPVWASNQNIPLPSEVSNIMIHPENGRVAMAFKYAKGEIQKVITLVFDISMVGEGKTMFHLTQLRTGSLPLKPSWLTNNINDEKLKRLTNEMVQGKVVDMTFEHPVDQSKKVTVERLGIHRNGVVADVLTQ